MAPKRHEPTVTDYLITALSPVLIMLMVGSFVFFLVEVLYEGEYTERLLYTLFFFVLGAVLIARISIEFGGGRAGIYALALGTVTWLALQAYLPSPNAPSVVGRGLIHLGLLLLIWWCAHKLTWDCTYIDERQRGAGRGILAAAGWEADGSARDSTSSASNASSGTLSGQKKTAAEEKDRVAETVDAAGSTPKRRRRPTRGDSRLWAWIEAYQKHREQQQKRPHTPGVWVLYCFLVALPVFALGQSLIDPADHERRRATFWQMAIFTASALGLLATTSLLGLRRYLRQRHARIPGALSSGWLLLAGGLIVVFLGLGAFLPRPHSETPWFGWQRVGSSTREASRYAVLKDAAGRGEGATGRQVKYGEGQASSTSSPKQTTAGSSSHSSASGGKASDTGNASSSDRGGSDQKPSPGGKVSSSHPSDKSNREEKLKDRPGSANTEDSIQTSGELRRNTDSSANGGGTSASNPLSHFSPVLSRMAGVVKWLVFVAVAVGVILVILIGVLRGLAPFTAWASRLLRALQQWWAGWWADRRRSSSSHAEPVGPRPRRPPPWASFSNPYEDGTADARDFSELVDYTLLAWEAWAYEQGCPRAESQTAWEFLSQLHEQIPEATDALQKFAALHAQVVYADKPLSVRQAHATLRQVWETLSLLPTSAAVASDGFTS
jgi:hypothetical protein